MSQHQAALAVAAPLQGSVHGYSLPFVNKLHDRSLIVNEAVNHTVAAAAIDSHYTGVDENNSCHKRLAAELVRIQGNLTADQARKIDVVDANCGGFRYGAVAIIGHG